MYVSEINTCAIIIHLLENMFIWHIWDWQRFQALITVVERIYCIKLKLAKIDIAFWERKCMINRLKYGNLPSAHISPGAFALELIWVALVDMRYDMKSLIIAWSCLYHTGSQHLTLWLTLPFRQYSTDYKLQTYLKIARLYLEDEDPVQAEAYINRASLLQTDSRNSELQIHYKVRNIVHKSQFSCFSTKTHYEFSSGESQTEGLGSASQHTVHGELSGSVVECLTWDRRAAGSSLTGVTALCPWAKH